MKSSSADFFNIMEFSSKVSWNSDIRAFMFPMLRLEFGQFFHGPLPASWFVLTDSDSLRPGSRNAISITAGSPGDGLRKWPFGSSIDPQREPRSFDDSAAACASLE